MNSWKKYVAGDNLKASDIAGTEPIYTIAGFGEKTFDARENKPAETKAFLRFREVEQQLSLNDTNIRTILGLFGDNPADAVGKRIQMMVVQTSLGDGIQIKKLQLNGAATSVAVGSVALKAQAWRKFQESNGGLSAADLPVKFRESVLSMFPGFTAATMTEDNWAAYVRSYDAAEFTSDEIPF